METLDPRLISFPAGIRTTPNFISLPNIQPVNHVHSPMHLQLHQQVPFTNW
jgi:hypothetical protein